ncbi:hypothetical protein J437_LFUL007468 [Ladona fulva]|uniref:Uncharacterized protein n=1 Tax=Ladona fulva TaxID=123851 RepID=A0A8K0P466_LADFU|nr:hypothetical protein J437_LFUL007468 [Ladona fulva]
MTSVDSGVETSNDSNDSSATHDYQPVENSSPVKNLCSALPPSQFNGFSSSSQDSEKDFKEDPDRRLSLTFRPPSLRTSGLQLGELGGIGTAASSSPSTSQITFSIPLKSLGASAFCGESSAHNKDHSMNLYLYHPGCKETLKTKLRVMRHRHTFLNPIGLQGTDVSSNDLHGRNPLKLAMSKLRLLKNLYSFNNDSEVTVNPDAQKIKMEVQQVIEMLQEYLNKKGRETEAELLTAFSSRLNLSSSQQEVDDEVRGLLTSLNSLTIQSPETSSSHPSTSSFLGASTSSTATQSTFLSFSTSASEQGASSSSQMTVSIPQLHPPPPVIPFRLPLGRFDFPNPSAMTNPFHLNPPCFEAPFAWVSSPSAPASSSEGDA